MDNITTGAFQFYATNKFPPIANKGTICLELTHTAIDTVGTITVDQKIISGEVNEHTLYYNEVFRAAGLIRKRQVEIALFKTGILKTETSGLTSVGMDLQTVHINF